MSLSEFQQDFTAHKNINAVLVPNDENAAPIIHYLQTQGVKAKTFPVTGQDATTIGLQNILAGYQCGTAYKPIYLEAEAAAALAMYLRAGKTPPATLVNGTHEGHEGQPVSGAVGAAHAEVGHHGQHGIDRRRGPVREGGAAVRRHLRDALQDLRDLVMNTSWLNSTSTGWLNARRRAR